MELLLSDLRSAWRNAARRPTFTLLVALTVALGIGVNSAIFVLLDAVLFKSLPFRDPSRLVFVWQTLPEHNVPELEATPFDYAAWHHVRSFAGVALIAPDAFTLAGDDNPERVRGARVTASLMPLLGIAPRAGRSFTPAEDGDGAAPVAILGDGLWRRRYGADPAVLGRSVRVNDVEHVIVGVMPPSATLPGPLAGNEDIWLPARMTPAERDNAISHNYSVVARLADGVSFESAAAELDVFARQLATEHADTHRGLGARIVPFAEQTVRAIRPTLLVVAGGVALLLVVACANASTLLLARAASRRHETAVRAALGATRGRLLWLAITESLVFSGLGGAGGLALGAWALGAFVPLFAGTLPAAAVGALTVDWRALVFTGALTAAVGLVTGVLVAAHQPHALADSLKASSRTATASGSAARTRRGLVVGQIALAVLLLSTAGLMLRSVAKLSRVSPGFDAAGVLTFRLSLSGNGYAEPGRRIAFANALTERLAAIPGVTRSGLTSMIPFGGSRGANGVEIEGRPKRIGESIIIDQRHVTPDYFQAMRIPLVRGRSLATTDDERSERVVLVNRTMADRYWPGGNPIDARVRVTAGANSGAWLRVVGVIEDVRHISLAREPVPEMYVPYAQAPVGAFTVVIRTEHDAAAAMPAAREALRSVDPALPIYDARPMTDRIAASFAQARATMWLLLVTAGLAAALAGVAIYGSIWYSVSQRIPEIGIRLALGATRASVCRSVIASAVALAAVGGTIGMAVAAASGPLLRGFLFDTSPADATTYVAVAAALLTLAMSASLVPARRAMAVEPIAALRSE